MSIVQYIFLRSDLKRFSKGAIIAQACHSTVKAIETYRECEDTREYLSNINNMHKIILKVSEGDLNPLLSTLNNHKIDFIEWIEQPEDIITSIALRPYEKESLGEVIYLFKQYKLW